VAREGVRGNTRREVVSSSRHQLSPIAFPPPESLRESQIVHLLDVRSPHRSNSTPPLDHDSLPVAIHPSGSSGSASAPSVYGRGESPPAGRGSDECCSPLQRQYRSKSYRLHTPHQSRNTNAFMDRSSPQQVATGADARHSLRRSMHAIFGRSKNRKQSNSPLCRIRARYSPSRRWF
jgi:hypothetical protein